MPTLLNKLRSILLASVGMACVCAVFNAHALDVPVPTVTESAPTGQYDTAQYDTALWTAFLTERVNEAGLVDYVAATNDANLLGFVGLIAKTDPGTFSDPNARKAFWINAYNALAIYGVCQRLPGDRSGQDAFSVIDQPIDGLAPNKGFFTGLKFMVGGQRYGLDEIEKRILLCKLEGMPHGVRARYLGVAPKEGDPRIHFALVCCALGCPRLQREAYDARRLDAQLDAATQAFLADPARSRFDLAKKAWSVSELMQWYEADFVDEGLANSEDTVIEFAANHVRDSSLARALRSEPWNVSYIKYDWKLNIWRK